MAESSTIMRESDQLQKHGEKTLWYMHISGPDDIHAVPDFWTGLAWAAELNAFIAEKAAKEKWAADDNWPLTQATIRRWPWAAEQHATLLARELSERHEHAEKRAAALSAKPSGSADQAAALAKLAEIPLAGSEERGFWLEAAEQHGFERTSGEEELPAFDPPAYFATEQEVLKLMAAAREQGHKDVLAALATGGSNV